MKLTQELNELNRYPFHMPGHKRNGKFNITGSEIDITEIDGFDNLHSPNGLLLNIEDRLSKLYKSEKSFLLVNGSTGGILASIFAVLNEGDKVIIARNCHKSVFNACYLRKLKIVYIEPEFDFENGFYGAISQKAIDNAIKNHNDAKAVIITTPTYEGIISNIECSIPLIIDSAHGAHLFDNYPKADIVISSLHKTLPALTQTAVANIYNKEYIDKFKLYNDIFETSSPSYVLMASVEKCLDYINENGCNIKPFNTDLSNLKIIKNDDSAKVVISTAGCNITGTELADILRNEYKIEVEMASINYVILILTMGDEEDAYEMLRNALEAIDKSLNACSKNGIIKPSCPKDIQTITIENGVEVELEDAIEKRSNEFIYAYPPDIPILCPNEVITEDIIKYIKAALSIGVNLISDSALLPNKLLTKAD